MYETDVLDSYELTGTFKVFLWSNLHQNADLMVYFNIIYSFKLKSL